MAGPAWLGASKQPLLLGLVLLLVGPMLSADALRGSAAHRRMRAHQKRSFPKYKHHPVSPEEDFFGDEVYPKGLYDNNADDAQKSPAAHDPSNPAHNPLGLVPHDWEKYPNGVVDDADGFSSDANGTAAAAAAAAADRRQLSLACASAICQGSTTCRTALSVPGNVYTCENLESLYCPGKCTEPTADCCSAVTTLSPEDTCNWQGTNFATSCGARTEAECYLTALEHETAGTAETMNLALTRRCACIASNAWHECARRLSAQQRRARHHSTLPRCVAPNKPAKPPQQCQ